MVAAIIGGTVDAALKTDLIRDVFVAAFQYALPSALRTEVLRIASYRLLCEEHHLLVRIEKIDGNAVRVTCEVNRKIKNIGSSTTNIGPSIHIDDWGFKQERSKIMKCTATFENGKVITGTPQTSSSSTIHFKGKEHKLEPGKLVTMATKWSEIRRTNDMVYIQFSCPTIDPEIDIPPVAGFVVHRSFARQVKRLTRRLQAEKSSKGHTCRITT